MAPADEAAHELKTSCLLTNFSGWLLDDKPFLLQPMSQLDNVFRIAGFDHAMHDDGRDVVTRKCAIMRNIDNAGAFLREASQAEAGESSGTVLIVRSGEAAVVAKPRSSTRPRMVVSILPPQSGRTTFWPCRSGITPAKQAARGAAPAPSTTAFSSSTRRKMASATSLSSRGRRDRSSHGQFQTRSPQPAARPGHPPVRLHPRVNGMSSF